MSATLTTPRKKVLLVEDDPSIRKLLQRHLATLNVEVIEAADVRSAKAQLNQLQPDLVCMDLILPESNGYALCEHIRTLPQLREVPILIISARASIEDRAYAEELGVMHYLTKPFSRADFLKVASGLLNVHVQAS